VNGVQQALTGGIEGGTVILLPALGELVGERSGVVNLGVEGCMLAGALASYAVAATTGNAWLGVGGGMLAGAACGLFHSWLVVLRKADQLASGLVVWFLALGITSVFGNSFTNQPVTPLKVISIPGLSSIPWIGQVLFRHDGLVYAGYLLVAAVWVFLYRTRAGLTLRATGERPAVVAASGKKPELIQTLAVTFGAALAGAGADIVRCTCNEAEAAEALARIVPRSPVPIVADVHFHHELALAALEAGVACLRLNPGNLRKPHEIKMVAAEARDRGVPIRIGVNAGSLHPDLYRKHGGATPEAMVESALMELDYFREVGFEDVKISVKASSVPLMVASYRLLADTVDHPLHLGVTEAGPPPAGLIKATAGMATLLNEGIGDTIRYSLTADPVEEARAGRQLLEALGLRERRGLDLIACPSCGRAEIDVIKVAEEARAALEERGLPIQVAVMGCVVNGPGEAREADLGIAAGRHCGHLFIKGRIVRKVAEDRMVEALVEEAARLVAEGVEARLAAADAGAESEAEADRQALLGARGADANASEARVELVRRRLEGA